MPSLSHLTAMTPPTIKNAQATPPNITLVFQGDLMASSDPDGHKMNIGIMNSGR
ncbi:MAG: hypothetical protein VYC44_10765 [Chloroflexota bacterium]|jgi:hypothetical protein|nr:hypothetical protein [Dehalococcoidia bacterium]MEC8911454.1 hypothetical protein [Chloroflexota bacterium]MCS5666398.1 hypothetical protein [Dehalococcoidia bacterium]MEC8960112.1 hypothetical protein [Chloroflexota bacterium]MEC9271745.1 hypothetical protein [Chloroflexota bacterium]